MSCGVHLVVSSDVPLNSSSNVHDHDPLGGAIGGAELVHDVGGCVVDVVDDVVVVDVEEVVVVEVDEVVVVEVVVVGGGRWNASVIASARGNQPSSPTSRRG